jgi:hypothetical protein
MPKYGYWLIEKTTVYHEVEADEKVFADEMVDSYLNSGEIDWGLGDMETTYEFDGEIKNA